MAWQKCGRGTSRQFTQIDVVLEMITVDGSTKPSSSTAVRPNHDPHRGLKLSCLKRTSSIPKFAQTMILIGD
jgi:hypothetical protein